MWYRVDLKNTQTIPAGNFICYRISSLQSCKSSFESSYYWTQSLSTGKAGRHWDVCGMWGALGLKWVRSLEIKDGQTEWTVDSVFFPSMCTCTWFTLNLGLNQCKSGAGKTEGLWLYMAKDLIFVVFEGSLLGKIFQRNFLSVLGLLLLLPRIPSTAVKTSSGMFSAKEGLW